MQHLRHVGFLVAVLASPLQAQRLEDAQVAAQRVETPAGEVSRNAAAVASSVSSSVSSGTSASTRSMVVGGLIGGAIGALGGAMVGMSAEHCDRSQNAYCGVGGAVLGGFIGEAIGVPIGVNWVGNGRGKLARGIPVSLAISVGGLMTGVSTYGLGVLAIVPGQIYTAIRAERGTM